MTTTRSDGQAIGRDSSAMAVRRSRVSTFALGFVICFGAAICPTTVAHAVAGDTGPASLDVRVAALSDRVAELAGGGNLLDSLHFGWFDRPRERATLAILVKTTAIFDGEVELRHGGRRAVADSTVEAMIEWAEGALARVILSSERTRFRPQRLRLTPSDLTLAATGRADASQSAVPPLYGFIDRSTYTQHHEVFGDLDLLAALGQRVYVRPGDTLLSDEAADLLLRRAGALGMAVITTIARTEGQEDAEPTGAKVSDTASVLRVLPQSLAELLKAGPTGLADATGCVIAVQDRGGGESWSSGLARRALARGILGRGRYAVADWSPPTVGGSGSQRGTSTAAAIWIHALEGQSLALVAGWVDPSAELGIAQPTMLTDSAAVETIAHTALDLMRLQAYVQPFEARAILAVAVDPDAIDSGDDNAWAKWIEPIWAGLVARQVRFDVVPAGSDEADAGRRYAVIYPLRRNGDAASTLARIERRLALEHDHAYRLTAREADGMVARDVFVVAARASTGEPCAAVANLTDEPRSLKLRGAAPLGAMRDVIADELVPDPRQRLMLGPCQVRLLWPAE